MPSLNKVMLIGNLTRDPQQRSLPSGIMLSQFGLACNRRWKSQTGEDREETCFVEIEAWGPQADFCARNLSKGAPVYVEGRLRMDSWQDKTTGQNRTRLMVVADYVQALERRNQMGGQGPSDYGQGGYGVPQGGYGVPQGGYGTPQGGYGVPQGGYGAPQGGYGAPQGGYGAPQGGYGAPQGGFNTPPSYGASQGGYGAPQGGYGAPQGGYGVPQGGYGAPQGGYGVPQGGYQQPAMTQQPMASDGAGQTSPESSAQEGVGAQATSQTVPQSEDDLIYESIPAKSAAPEAAQPQPPNPEATAVVDDTPF